MRLVAQPAGDRNLGERLLRCGPLRGGGHTTCLPLTSGPAPVVAAGAGDELDELLQAVAATAIPASSTPAA